MFQDPVDAASSRKPGSTWSDAGRLLGEASASIGENFLRVFVGVGELRLTAEKFGFGDELVGNVDDEINHRIALSEEEWRGHDEILKK